MENGLRQFTINGLRIESVDQDISLYIDENGNLKIADNDQETTLIVEAKHVPAVRDWLTRNLTNNS